MTRISLEQFMFGNRHWRSYRAVDEIEVYCDLLENLQDRIDSLETPGKDEEVTLSNVQAVISSYAFEIAMKSLWALDNSDKSVPHKHDLPYFFDGLGDETVQVLQRLQVTREVLEVEPKPFMSYSDSRSLSPNPPMDGARIAEGGEEVTDATVRARNRYSMEHRDRTISVFTFQTLRALAQLVRDKGSESRKSLFRPPQS